MIIETKKPAEVKQPRPQFSEDRAPQLASELYGITATVRELPSERDQNFHLTSQSGDEFVLKIAASNEKRETLEFQNSVLARLEGRLEGAFVPRVCVTKAGQQIATTEDPDGTAHMVRLLTYHPSAILAHVHPHSPELLHSLGRVLGLIDKALDGFSHAAAHRDLKWNLKGARWIADYVHHIDRPDRRAIVEHFLRQFETVVEPVASRLRTSVIHNDANDYNVLVDDDGWGNKRVAGVIDYGDMVHSYTACEPAVAAAYAMLDKSDPLATASEIVTGYHEVFPLTDLEVEVLYTLICTRLAVSVTNSALQQKLHPDNEYLTISERPAWELLEKLYGVDPALPHYIFRRACNLTPCPQCETVGRWLRENAGNFAPVVEADMTRAVVLDLSVGSLEFGDLEDLTDIDRLTRLVFDRMKEANAPVGIGRYNEPRLVYTSDLFTSEGGEPRTVHLGIDLFMKAGSPVFAPLDGRIHSFANNRALLDYGPTIILQHEADGGRVKFFTLYGHLSAESLEGLYDGKPIKRGDRIASIGAPPVNGGWPPHLHFQIICDLLGKQGDFPGVALPSQREVWLSICPDPNLILGIPQDRFPAPGLNSDRILELRRRHVGPSLSIAYRKPLHIVRGFMQHLYDAEGRRYLDAVNNVAHVGHCHPRVVGAAARQMRALNTNTRYLHENLVRFGERLATTMPGPLKVCFFVCSGSEANELALRVAHAHTRGTEIVCVDGAYHGNTTSLIGISPYKFDGPGGEGAAAGVHKVAMPDTYRGPHKAGDPDAGRKYAAHVGRTVEEIRSANKKLSAFICEPALGCGGQIILPADYLKEVYARVREAGGVCIADEVQTGLGRVGSHFWAFETQGVVPDIVTVGKPIGNGHPLAAVVTTPEIAASFDNGMEYFNTFGGNPVSCAAGMAVLDVIEDERLQENAARVGAYLKRGLEGLKDKHALIGDVRGMGLFIGVELVLDRETLAPAARRAAYVVERMKDCGILISTDGPLHNVLKIKPPLVFSEEKAGELANKLDTILAEDFRRPISVVSLKCRNAHSLVG
ncbi:MAG TPA: aminotransferase class III-fold pyridoxal phosphate-dependent enzyme [Blastocatellia bacterium]|nr:aminotransferase class III-fold pyridoxal phosphate-dependent enzyme [Blastocatellia bacterium]